MSDTIPRPSPPSEVLDSDRDRAIATIQAAVAQGRLTLEQFDERAEMVEQATTRAALEATTSDLPFTDPGARVAQPSASVPAMATTPRNYSAIFGSVRDDLAPASGPMPRAIKARAIFGSVALDFSAAVFQPGVTELHCTSAFGSVELTFPAGVHVEMAGRSIFGSFERKGRATQAEGVSTPVVRVTGSAVFGAVEAASQAPAAKASPPRLTNQP